jgi:hypothetical protein
MISKPMKPFTASTSAVNPIMVVPTTPLVSLPPPPPAVRTEIHLITPQNISVEKTIIDEEKARHIIIRKDDKYPPPTIKANVPPATLPPSPVKFQGFPMKMEEYTPLIVAVGFVIVALVIINR